jgi:glucose uptake protein GlcU
VKKVRAILGVMAVVLPLAGFVLTAGAKQQAEIQSPKPESITVQVSVSI